MKLRVVVSVLIMLLCLPVFANTAVLEADVVVKNTADSVLERLSTEKEVLEAHPERIYDLINELVIPHFDFSSMSKWVLGKNWRSATDRQQQDFVSQFKTLLVRTYAKALLEYSEEEIEYLDTVTRPDSSLVTVKTIMQGGSGANPIPINYSLHLKDGEWKVVDVSVDGVSLVSTYRGSFASEIRKNGLDSLISKLSERNDKLASTLAQE